MILSIYRFIAGWLNVEFYGEQVSRFLNLCTRQGIHLWKVRKSKNGGVETCIYLNDVKRLRPGLRKTHVRFRILRKNGLPFVLHRYRKRKIFAGILLLIVIGTCILSTRVWRIEFVGNQSLSEETLLDYLEEHKIAYGTSKGSIDNDALELSLRQDFDPVIWASVYEKGTKLVVCIQEKIVSDRSASIDEATPVDLVASKDAKVQSVITRKGISVVKAGDSVKKGDLLVNGRQEILDDNGEVKEYYYETADADIIGRVVYDYEDWIDSQVVEATQTGEKHVRFFVRVGAHQFTTPALHAEYDHSVTMEDNRQLCLMDSFYLPVYFGTITEYQQIKTDHTLDFAEAKSIGIQHLEHFLANLEQNGVSIIDKNVMIEKIDLKYHIYGKVTAEESIIKQQPTEVLPDPVVESTQDMQEE